MQALQKSTEVDGGGTRGFKNCLNISLGKHSHEAANSEPSQTL